MNKRDFEPADLLQINDIIEILNDKERLALEANGQRAKIGGVSATITDDDGKVVACGGITILWEGTGEAWIVLSKSRCHSASLFKLMRTIFDGWIREKELHRIQGYIRDNWEEGDRFERFFGLQKECLLRKYGPNGIDQMLYARVI